MIASNKIFIKNSHFNTNLIVTAVIVFFPFMFYVHSHIITVATHPECLLYDIVSIIILSHLKLKSHTHWSAVQGKLCDTESNHFFFTSP